MNRWLHGPAIAVLLLLAGCAGTTGSSNPATTDTQAALRACQTQAAVARYQPQGRGLVGLADHDRFVAECLRNNTGQP